MIAALLLALSPLWAGLEPGPFTAGFETMPLRDYSRPFRDHGEPGVDRIRLLTVSIWYPAEPAETHRVAPLSFGRYVGTDTSLFRQWLEASGYRVGDRELEQILATEIGAVENAARADGSFPLLLFGGGLEAPTYLQSVLCEYLATHGYIAVAVPMIPHRAGVSAQNDALTVDAHARDLEIVIHELRDYPGADIQKLGLVGWGVSSVSQVLVQMKNPDVAAVVSLDAATGYRYGYDLLTQSLYFDPSRATVPFFHATDSRESAGMGRSKSSTYLDDVHRGPTFLLELWGATRAELTSLLSVVPTEQDEAVRRRYELLCRYVRRFLDLAIRDDADAREFFEVTPSRHGFDGLVLSKRGVRR